MLFRSAFFASVEQAMQPQLRDKPIAVIGAHDRTVVLAASYSAKKYGVKTGITKYAAAAACPELIFVTSDPYKYMDISTRIMDHLDTYSSCVEVCSIDEAFLDITGSLYLFGTSDNIATMIKKDIYDEAGITCSIGIAPNKLMAKLAANMQKPDGLVTLSPEDFPHCLEDVSVSEICGIGRRTTEWLASKGIHKCGQLQKVPLAFLRRRFGVTGEWLHNAAHGRDSSRVIPKEENPPARSIGHSMTLKNDAETRGDVDTFLLQLAEMTGRRLRAQHATGKTVTVFVRYASFASEMRRRTTDTPLFFSRDIYRIACDIWHSLPFSEPVRGLGISISSLEFEAFQGSLFRDEEACYRRTLVQDAVNDRFGAYTLMPASLLERHRREHVIAPSWRPHKRI